MKNKALWLAVMVACLLLVGAVGCSGSGKDDVGDTFKPESTEVKRIGTSFKLRARLKGHEGYPQDLAISPDGQFAVSAGGKALHVWSIPEPRAIRNVWSIPEAGAIRKIQVIPEQAKSGIAPGKAWGRGMRCNDYYSETFRWNPAGPNPAR